MSTCARLLPGVPAQGERESQNRNVDYALLRGKGRGISRIREMLRRRARRSRCAGLMTARHASLNDLPIREEDRKVRWRLGRRAADHTGLSSSGFRKPVSDITPPALP